MSARDTDNLIFTARPLRLGEHTLVFPLVSFRYPHLSLDYWEEFVTGMARVHGGDDHLMAIVDSRGHFHAVFAYWVEPSLNGVGRLRIVHIASASLVGDATNRAFHAAIDKIARENGCTEVVIEVEDRVAGLRGCDERSALERAGFTQTPMAYMRSASMAPTP